MCTKSLSCPLCCQSIFPNIDALRLSLLKVTSRPIKCPICADELLGLDKLTIHLFGHSILGKEERSAPLVDKKKSVTNALKNVRKTKKESTPGSSGQQQNVARSQQKQAGQMNHAANVKCDVCGDEFRDQNLLKMHSCVSHGPGGSSDGVELRFPCNMCSKTFKMKGSLKIHMRVVHLGCPKKSSSNTSCTSSSTTTTITTTTAVPVYYSNDVTQCNLSLRSTVYAPPPLQPIQPQHVSPQSQRTPPPQPMISQRPTPHSPLQSATSLTITTPNSSEPQIIKILDPRQLTEYVYVSSQTQPQLSQQHQQQQQAHQLPQHPSPQQQQQVVERIIANSTPPSVPSPLATTPTPTPSCSNIGNGNGSCSSVSSPSQPSPSPQSTSINSISDGSNKHWECDVCLKSFTTKYFLKKHKRLHTG